MADPGSTRFPWTNGPFAVDSVYGPWTYSTRALEWYKNTPEPFQNYILVPKNLHLGPCISIYIYNLVLFLINSVYIISFLTH
jgi:hypothetical protein